MQQMRVRDRKRVREREEERERYSDAADMLTDPAASPAISATTAATERERDRERAQLQPCPLSLTHEYANMRWLASSTLLPPPLAALMPFTWIAALFINLLGPEQARQDTLAENAVVAFAAITAADMDIDMLHGHGHCCLLIDCSHLGIDVVYSASPDSLPPVLCFHHAHLV